MSERRPPPPRPRKRGAPVKGKQREQTPELVEAKARTAAAKMCATSLYAGIAAAVMFFLPFVRLGSFMAALLAIGAGIVGVVRLTRVGMGAGLSPEVTGLERVSIRMAARARPQAFTGITVGVLVLGVVGFFHFASVRAAEKRAANQREWEDAFGSFDSGKLSKEIQREVEAEVALDLIGERMTSTSFAPKNALSEDEVARKLLALLEKYGDTEVVERLDRGGREPYKTMRRILVEHGWEPPVGDR